MKELICSEVNSNVEAVRRGGGTVIVAKKASKSKLSTSLAEFNGNSSLPNKSSHKMFIEINYTKLKKYIKLKTINKMQ